MKQQVNFFSEQFMPKKDLLSLDNMVVAWIAGIVLILALYNFEMEKAEISANTLTMTKQRQQHQQKQLESLQRSFSNRGDMVVLEKTFADMDLNLSQRNYVINQLGQRVDGMSKGVAGLMEDLARVGVKGLWLTSINVNQGQLSVSGVTKDAEKVPQFIQQLQEITALKNKRFARLEIKPFEDNTDLLTFTLQSENSFVSKDGAK